MKGILNLQTVKYTRGMIEKIKIVRELFDTAVTEDIFLVGEINTRGNLSIWHVKIQTLLFEEGFSTETPIYCW